MTTTDLAEDATKALVRRMRDYSPDLRTGELWPTSVCNEMMPVIRKYGTMLAAQVVEHHINRRIPIGTPAEFERSLYQARAAQDATTGDCLTCEGARMTEVPDQPGRWARCPKCNGTGRGGPRRIWTEQDRVERDIAMRNTLDALRNREAG